MSITTKRATTPGRMEQLDALSWRATLSSSEPDCVGDRIFGWTWPAPTIPVLVGHDPAPPPVAGCRPYVEPARLRGILTFPKAGTSQASDDARRLVEEGVAQALSIGFRGVGTPNAHGGLDYATVQVIEVSLVGLGCNFQSGIGTRAAKACACHDGDRLAIRLRPDSPAEVRFRGEPRFSITADEVRAATLAGLEAAIAKTINFGRGGLDGAVQRAPRRFS